MGRKPFTKKALRLITITELAGLAGVSTATVSNVIHGKKGRVSPERYQYIQELLKKNNYVEKMGLRHLKKNRSRIICLAINRPGMYTENPIFADPFYAQIFGVIEQALHEKDYYLMTYSSENIEDIFRTVAAWNIDGIIAVSFDGGDCDKLLELTKKPLVSIDTAGRLSDRFIHVGSEDAQGAYLMTKHLISQGRRDIFVYANCNSGCDHERYRGYKKAMREAGIKPLGKLVFAGRNAAVRLRQYEKYTIALPEKTRAVFFLGDFYAIEFIAFLGRKGIAVPDQIAVAGFDDTVYAGMSNPGLTTVRQDIQRKALTALDCLFQLLGGGDTAQRKVLLPIELIVRDSA
jgi:LacI family transcriptional regulator